jgi:hypothetical protein
MKTGIYIGTEFPDYFQCKIYIEDSWKDNVFPCYKIRFEGENYWHDNIDDDDILFD